MADIEKRLERLEDRANIADLIASYGPLADRGAAHELAALWTEDGEYHVGGFGIARGREEIAALITSRTHQDLMKQGCAHVLSPHTIVIDGSSAVATGYSTVYRTQDYCLEAWRVSRNRWELERGNDGKWLVTRRINSPITPGEAAS
ncbi:nuclear transport factor 2 family protein [Erythrobacter alti]|uniref:nuclear transport factor 2 family protein n=1 Tax=Erythrobacter alti TaxID=1896145 RepID=UPI0030F39816